MKTPDEIKKGLECCSNKNRRCRKDCPYIDDGSLDALIPDALALINQLEEKLAEYEKPLVPLPLDDILKLDDTGDAWWVEYKGGNLTPTILTNDCRQYGEQILHGYVFKLYDYSKTWRCWARKPTDEERKAVKWDD